MKDTESMMVKVNADDGVQEEEPNSNNKQKNVNFFTCLVLSGHQVPCFFLKIMILEYPYIILESRYLHIALF